MTGCRYQFEPAVWSRDHDEPSPVAGPWDCPREAVEGEDYCPFHLSAERRRDLDIDSESLCRQVRDELDAEDTLAYIGATFEDLDLSTLVVERPTNDPIDLRHTTIRGDLDLTEASVHQPLRLERSTIEGDLSGSNAHFHHAVRGANLSVAGRITFENATFGNTVCFREGSFAEQISFGGTTFERDADFYRVDAAADCRFRNTVWEKDCLFQMATFGGKADFFSADFHDRTDFRSVTFGGIARFSKSRFENEALLLDATFEREALFKKIDFSSYTYFQGTEFGSEASFSETTFGDKAKFQFAVFRDEAAISYAVFRGNAYFQHARLLDYAEFFECTFEEIADFRWTRFHGVGRFMDAEFDALAYFSKATFFDVSDFRDARFRHTVIFRETIFQTPPIFQRASFETIHLVDVESETAELTLDFEASVLRKGQITQTTDVEAYYNFGEATLGDIDLDIETDGRLFENFRISRTTFDGFDFSRYHYALSPEWNLHTFAGQTDVDYDTEASRFELGDRVDAEELIDGAAASTAEEVASSEDHSGTFDRLTGISKRLGPTRILHAAAQALREAPALETTYLKAKNGANEVGDSRAASSFFVREMYYRRNSHVKRAVASSERVTTRIRAGLLACMNLLLSISCGYGEKPYRTLLFSLGTVVVYWPIYVAVLDTPPFGTFPGYLLFSFQSFTALMLGVDTEMFGLLGTFVAVSQGFVGAFLIGLFVFTLTRSIHR